MTTQPRRNRLGLAIDLSDPASIPEEGIERAVQLMRSGRLFRYGEAGAGELDVPLLEKEFAEYLGRRYCAALNSCGSAMFVALKCAGVEPGDRVLVNGFTLAPVPGAIAHAAAEPVLVECTEDLTIDLADLAQKAACGARVLLLSHMRGHIGDMDAVTSLCARLGLTLIEDCAHTLGAGWNGRLTGTFGHIGCFSAQTFKHVNSGEGGLLVTDDQDAAARAILFSGSYMLYAQHLARPPLEVFERHKCNTPNLSLRMSALAAAVLRPQLGLLPERILQWNRLYRCLSEHLGTTPQVRLPLRPPEEDFVGSSIQFRIVGLTAAAMERVLEHCDMRGVHIKWFGRPEPVGFTSRYETWAYIPSSQELPRTRRILECLCDIRIPLTLSEEDCRLIATIIAESIEEALAA